MNNVSIHPAIRERVTVKVETETVGGPTLIVNTKEISLWLFLTDEQLADIREQIKEEES